MGISLNPAPGKEGQLNPFSLKSVRFALQYLIDRDEIAESAYGGYAIPVVVDMIPEHPSYEAIKPSVDSYEIKYNKEKALLLINEAMIDAGAEKINDKWNYNGKEIILLVQINSESEQSALMAELVSSKLESVGFVVEKSYYTRSEENEAPMYATDPAELKWHIYVTGWIFYSASKYQEAAFPELVSKEGWWKYENAEIEDIKEQFKTCSTKEEWEELNKKITKLQIEDSQGIWLIAKKNIFAARNEVAGLTQDDYIGMRSFGNAREAYVPGKNNLVIGQKYLYEEGNSWNPVVIEGINMMDIVNTIHDPAIWTTPKTLEPSPFRWGYSIEMSEQVVPNGAFVWDVENKNWILAVSDTAAKTKVSYDLSRYIGTKWHHDQKISWADILVFVASTWDRAYDSEKQKISNERWQEYFEQVKGLRIAGNTLEVYLDKEDFDESNLLGFAKMFQRSAPWEIYAASDKLVFGQNGFEYGEERNPELKLLSLINKDHISLVLTTLDSLEYSEIQKYVSVAGQSYLTEQEFNERKSALHKWYDEHGHLIVSDGPFYMDKYVQEDNSIELKAFRDKSYPFKKGDLLI